MLRPCAAAHSGGIWHTGCDPAQVTLFYTAPTAIRALERMGNQWVKKHKCSSLRLLASVGEPLNPEAWRWYYQVSE